MEREKQTGDFFGQVMVQKRCNMPKSQSIVTLNRHQDKSYKTIAELISFQNYHFIDIISPNEPTKLHSIYPTVASVRTQNNQLRSDKQNQNKESSKNKALNQEDIHVVQSMALLGMEEPSFWDKAVDIVYVTFIQLHDSFTWAYDEIAERIKQYFSESKEKNAWVLYYSLDFCDLILCTKGIRLSSLNEFLWEMTIGRYSGFEAVKDSYTICTFSKNFLTDAFKSIEEGKAAAWEDQLIVTCNIGLQSRKSLDKVYAAIKRSGINFAKNRMTGRFDLQLISPLSSGTDILRFLYELDRLTIGEKEDVLANFEVLFSSPIQDKGEDIAHENSFRERNQPVKQGHCDQNDFQTTNLRELKVDEVYSLCKEIEKSSLNIEDYVLETLHSLQALIRNGFAEEFIYSIWPSFKAYLNIMKELNKRLPEDFSGEVYDFSSRLTEEYFTALNTISSCTMHEERQFIKSPSFNAVYFEIPPKMLVFYNAVVNKIRKNLQTEMDVPYNFIVAPDYRRNINVYPYLCAEKDMGDQNLAIIYLSEEFFYAPTKAIMLLAHEIGHYLGDRKREERLRIIFRVLGQFLCAYTLRYPEKYKHIEWGRLPERLGDALGDFMYLHYCDVYGEEDVAYLGKIDFFVEEFVEKYFSEGAVYQDTALYCLLSDTLYQLAAQNSEMLGTYRKILETLNEDVASDYFSGSAIFRENGLFGCRVLAHQLFHAISECFDPRLSDDSQIKRYREIMRAIINAFSESYADLQMLRVCGKSIPVEQYAELLLNESDSRQTGLEVPVRFHVLEQLCRRMECQNKNVFAKHADKFTYSTYSYSFQKMIEDALLVYLDSCDRSFKTPDWISDFFDSGEAENSKLTNQVHSIVALTAEYRDELLNIEKE